MAVRTVSFIRKDGSGGAPLLRARGEALALVCAALLGAGGCLNTGEIEKVTVNPASVTVEQGGQCAFVATVEGTGIPDQAVQWSLVWENGAPMDTAGRATGVTTGGTLYVDEAETISPLWVQAASAVNPKIKGMAEVEISGEASVTGVTVSPQAASVPRGGSRAFQAKVVGAGALSQKVTWSLIADGQQAENTAIDAQGVLSIDRQETLSALTVAATSAANRAKTGTVVVMVETTSAAVSKVTVSPAGASVVRGGAIAFSAAVEGEGQPSQQVRWSLEQAESVKPGTTIDANGILVLSAEETRVDYFLTVKAVSLVDEAVEGSADVWIAAPGDQSVWRVTISPKTGSIAKGGELTLSASVEGSGSPVQAVVWDIPGEGRSSATCVTDGNLIVAIDEALPRLKVRARSILDAGKEGSALVSTGSENCLVVFKGCGGVFEHNNNQEELSRYAATGSLIAPPAAPRKAGSRLQGWHKSAALDDPWNFDNDRVTQDITLYAAWVEEAP